LDGRYESSWVRREEVKENDPIKTTGEVDGGQVQEGERDQKLSKLRMDTRGLSFVFRGYAQSA
jgi:hypothetical protein